VQIFGVGLSRTGTTSLSIALADIGLICVHYDMLQMRQQHTHTSKRTRGMTACRRLHLALKFCRASCVTLLLSLFPSRAPREL
jgi:hypothetical protein